MRAYDERACAPDDAAADARAASVRVDPISGCVRRVPSDYSSRSLLGCVRAFRRPANLSKKKLFKSGTGTVSPYKAKRHRRMAALLTAGMIATPDGYLFCSYLLFPSPSSLTTAHQTVDSAWPRFTALPYSTTRLLSAHGFSGGVLFRSRPTPMWGPEEKR